MKTKTSSKLNILLIAITLLLIFVACGTALGSSGSWLVSNDNVGFTINVQDINIKITQTIINEDNSETEYEIENNGSIYFGTSVIEADKAYNLNVEITNEEDKGAGFYIRYQALAVINGTTYNINNYITTTQFYQNTTDGWYYSNVSGTSTLQAMASNETRTMIDTITFPASFISSLQGKHLKLYLYIEGSPDGIFNAE